VLSDQYRRLGAHRFLTDATAADDWHIWTQSHWQRWPQSACRLRSGVFWRALARCQPHKTRFKRSRTVAAHFGLTPRRCQSGEHDNPGRISKAGDRDVRATLYAAANALLMRTMARSHIKSWGMRLIGTRGRRRAVVAVARKLTVLLHRMWIDGTEFGQDPVGG
jgi:hypothetical protein